MFFLVKSSFLINDKRMSRKELFEKYIRNECSVEEINELITEFGSSLHEEELKKIIQEYLQADSYSIGENTGSLEVKREELRSLLRSYIGKSRRTAGIQRLWKIAGTAAAVIVCLAAGFYFYYTGFAKNELAANDIPPGSNKAILTLADGRMISLSDAANGEIAREAGLKVTKSANGQIVYTVDPQESQEQAILFNTISTPRGGQYSVRLPDGSVVHLNAGSSLKFPVRFAASERRVMLTGEAFFEVNLTNSQNGLHSKIPFIVESSGQEVKVLGTVFNISAYPEDAIVKTTLLEGSVEVNAQNSGQKQLLKPGFQSLFTNNTLKIKKVDSSDEVAWKKGLFIFDVEPLQGIMRRIARWYDIDVIYNDVNKDELYWGSVSRYENISKVLERLEAAGGVKFKIDGRKVIVSN